MRGPNAFSLWNAVSPGCAPARQTQEALPAHQQAENEKWWPIIKAAGIKAE
jgi:hypothetical protein